MPAAGGEISMKSLLLATSAVLVLGAASAHAQTPPAAWQGSVTFVKTPSPACDNIGFSEGSLATSIYRANFSGSPPNAGLSILGARGGTAIFDGDGTHPTLAGTVPFNGVGLSGRATISQYTGTSKLVVTPKPSPLTATTKQVTITGTITNFFNNPGCTVTIEGSYFLRP
jgi:hypothetical protein